MRTKRITRLPAPPSARVWAKVARRGPDDCWPWTGSRNHLGYGRVAGGVFGKGVLYAHRVIYVLTYGDIPDGAIVLHKCQGGGNPWCCNPAHFSLGDPEGGQKENSQDMVAAGRHWAASGVWSPPRGELAKFAKLTAQQVAEARRRVRSGEWRETLASEFGVTVSTIDFAVTGKTWKHVDEPPIPLMGVGGRRMRHQ